MENNEVLSFSHLTSTLQIYAPNTPTIIPATPELDPLFAHLVISAVTPTPTSFLPSWSIEKKLDATVEINEWLLEENCTLTARLNSAEAHCILAMQEMGDLKRS